MSITINGIVASKIGFASHQNSVPVLKDLTIQNNTAEDLFDLVLEMTSDPPMVEEQRWLLDSLPAGSSIQITQRAVKLRGGALSELTESQMGEVLFRLTRRGEVIAHQSHSLSILARNHWGGCCSMTELLPAFCMPNDPAVDKILKAASDVLRRAGKPDGINGYESKSRTRTWELVSSIWSAVAGLDISYTLPPSSFEDNGQKIRTPGTVLEGRMATCLDTALLFAAVLEQCSLNPLVIITRGHAFVGVWLQPQEFASLLTEDASAVRKRVELQELVVFETTLATQSPVPGFSRAVEIGKRQLTDEEFLVAVDIRRARMQSIRPLASSPTARPNTLTGDSLTGSPVSEGFEEAPDLPAFDVDVTASVGKTADKLGLWQRKLLDLTTRNRLLHLPEKSKSIPLLCPDPASLEDMLADGKRIRISALPDLESGGRDAVLHEQRERESMRDKFAAEALEKAEVLSVAKKEDLEADLIEMYRKARTDLDEGGANTLFLAIGFLRWKKTPGDVKSYRAPIILLPVKLERKSALSGVTMVIHEDEPRFNLTLLELLRQDFQMEIPALEGSLPTDASGLDVENIWNHVKYAVRDVPGFEVTKEVVLSTFSFAKYLMWKDLIDGSDMILASPVVKQLLGRETELSDKDRGGMPLAEELDRRISPATLFTPLPADSSQLAAVVASAEGFSFVLDGPPGTGKSQTIANMIAHNLGLGRRVLFVAEKRAALEVVYRRLAAHGLGEFCLEVHSNKTSKVDVLKQLERAWDSAEEASAGEWEGEAANAGRLRDRLNEWVALLHRPQPNGLTLHRCIGRAVRDVGEGVPRLQWPAGHRHNHEDMTAMLDVVKRLGLYHGALEGTPREFRIIGRTEWSNGWQDALASAAAELPSCIDNLRDAAGLVVARTGLPLPANTPGEMVRLTDLVRSLLSIHGKDVSIAFAPDAAERIPAIHRAAALVGEYRNLERDLSARYAPEAARRIDLTTLDREWEQASRKLWFLASMAKKKVIENLTNQGGVTGQPDLIRDAPKLRRMRVLLESMDETHPRMTGVPGWAGPAGDPGSISEAAARAESLRSAISACAATPEHLAALRAAARLLVVEANEMLSPNGAIHTAAAQLEASLKAFHEAAGRFMELCSYSSDPHEAELETLRNAAQRIHTHRTRLKAWCDWHRVREEAAQSGLAPIVLHAERENAGAVTPELMVRWFETAYARWFGGELIDEDPRLRNFVAAEHMSEIENFRAVDDRLAELSVRYIRAVIRGRIPARNDVSKNKGFSVLQRELQKQRRHKPLRQLAIEMGDALGSLAPCMLMSPLSIAQYLPAGQAPFDLVIFDEASQIAPWDAVGAIARGRQVVIAGDPRQMPPSNFFNRAASASEDDVEDDMESVLDECLASGIPSHSLTWHYRSRHESLIAFSNNRYYDGRLITFPAAVTRRSAVSWRLVDGIYARGAGRNNQEEAKAIVAETVRLLTDPEFIAGKKTLAIITLNTEQQRLIEDLLDVERRRRPEIEFHFGESASEPLVVKNLETVQGDERDYILLGIGYGPTEPGAKSMSMSFGPLNRDGGWRRLNVAVTRARQEMIVFTSFDPSMVDLNRTDARAVRDLKHFVEFADRGPQALSAAVHGSRGGYDSPFEEAVAAGLTRLGWQVVPQIGVSRFRIDLGIVHPDRPGDYLMGIECDGATYHSAATARDRDKVRAAILRGLGWNLLRLWSTDWWVDKARALQALHSALESALEASRTTPLSETGTDSTPADQGSEEQPPLEIPLVDQLASPHSTNFPLHLPSDVKSAVYTVADFTSLPLPPIPDRFHEDDYEETLNAQIGYLLSLEGPLEESLLVQKIARLHGFQKSGRIIRERVLDLVERNHHPRPDAVAGRFVWPSAEAPLQWALYRQPHTEDQGRKIDEIPFEEIRAAALACPGGDTALEVARLFGIRRLSTAGRERIEAVIRFLNQTTSPTPGPTTAPPHTPAPE